MAVNTEAFLALGTMPEKKPQNPYLSESESTLESLYSGTVGEGGRNNALTRLVGSLRAKRIPYEAALEIARGWNSDHCSPPLDTNVVNEMVSRAWVDWEWQEEYEDMRPRSGTRVEVEGDGSLKIITGDEVLETKQVLNWTMRGILLEGGLHYLSGPPAGGKSWLALEMCRVITTGGKFFNTYDAVQGACLYVDEEMGAGMTAHRMGLLGFKPAPDFYYMGKQGFHLGLSEHRQQLLDFAVEKGVKFLVFDTLRGCCPGLKENESEHVTRLRGWFGAFTREGITLLVLHHDRKSQNGEQDAGYERMAGSADFAGMADMAYAIDRSQGVHHLKVSKNRLLPEEDAVSVHYELKQVGHDRVSIEVVNIRKKQEEILEEISKEVLTTLRDRGKMKPSMIATTMGLSLTEANNALTWLYAREYVTKDRENFYECQQMF